MEEKTSWAKNIRTIAKSLLVVHIVGGGLGLSYCTNEYSLNQYFWVPIVVALSYAAFSFPLMMGFSKIVEAAEKQLQ